MIVSVGLTDIGLKRSSNQDSIYCDDKQRFYCVADGMGGHNGGDIASQTTVKLLPDFIAKSQDKKIDQRLTNGINYINNEIHEHAAREEGLKGMGTTLSCAYFDNEKVYIGHVGDSRAYLIQDDQLFQLTRDHSMVQEKLYMGIYDRQAAAADPQKNVLVRSVGFEETVQSDIYFYKYRPGDLFLLCSDGLHGKISDPDILYILKDQLGPGPNKDTLLKSAQTLIEQANANGGEDNISVVLIYLT